MFSFLLRGQKRKDLHCDGSQDNSCVHKNKILNRTAVSGSACCYLFSFVLQVPLFSAGSKENKSNSKLCVLRASAVSIVLPKIRRNDNHEGNGIE